MLAASADVGTIPSGSYQSSSRLAGVGCRSLQLHYGAGSIPLDRIPLAMLVAANAVSTIDRQMRQGTPGQTNQQMVVQTLCSDYGSDGAFLGIRPA